MARVTLAHLLSRHPLAEPVVKKKTMQWLTLRIINPLTYFVA